MSSFALTARKRGASTKGTLNAMRREGRVPGVIYGPKTEPETLEVTGTDLRQILEHRNAIIEVNLDGKTHKAMVKQVDRDPIRGDLKHIDFLCVDEIHPVIVTVPVSTTGIPIGVKTQGGVLSVAKKFVRIRAKIQDIPDSFVIDVSDMESGKTYYVKDLPFTKGTFVTPPRTALFGVGEGRAEEVAATPAAAAPAAAAAAPAAGDKGKAAAPAAAAKPAPKKK